MAELSKEDEKKFPVWGAWAGVGIAILAIIILTQFHVSSRMLALIGPILAVVTMIVRWNVTAHAKRLTLFIVPSIAAVVLFIVFLVVRHNLMQPQYDPTPYVSTDGNSQMFGNQYGEDASHPQPYGYSSDGVPLDWDGTPQ
jgi:hypothetical protein